MIYIFDLDGTLSDTRHRIHFIQQEPKDWSSFYAACVDDPPFRPVLDILHIVRGSGDTALIWTGRSDEVKDQTVEWLDRHDVMGRYEARNHDLLQMRKAGDHRDDVELKREWWSTMGAYSRRILAAVFEDRTRVVQMWRSVGVTCFQVNDGDF